jgi:hypothetical protein
MADGTSTSLACSPDNAPIQFHWYPADHGQTLAQCLTNVLIEPAILGHVGIGLHLHLKNTAAGTDREVKKAQDAEIDIATRRCATGASTNWDFGKD